MLATIRKTVAREGLLGIPAGGEPGGRVLVAVSGGPDSMALLHALRELGPELGVTLEAATVDHGLRPESAREAAEVARQCADLTVPCAVLRVDVSAARAGHVSLQDAARRVRLGALEEAARGRGCRWVALGHTADDQAETLLFRIVRGTGLRGLAGIPYARPPFVRPLLDVRRSELLRFLRQRRIAFVEDPSNQDRRFTRSRVRYDWLPFLARENPRVVEALVALGREARSLGTPATTLPAAGQPPMGRRAADRVAELVRERRGTRSVHFAGGVADVVYGQVQLRQRDPRGEVERPALDRRVEIPGPGQYRWDGGGEWEGGAAGGGTLEIDVRLQTFGEKPNRSDTSDRGGFPLAPAARFDCACLSEGLYLRHLRAGDRMRPRGGIGSRKLQDLLVDAKIPRSRRGRLPVLCTADGTILFVPGLRPSAEGAPQSGAEHWIEIRTHSSRANASGEPSVG